MTSVPAIDCTRTSMFTHPHMPQPTEAQLRDYVMNNPFCHLMTASPEAGVHCTALTVIPEDTGPEFVLLGHLATRNTHSAALSHASTGLLLFAGPQAYVSPRWYRERPDAPTWNYLAVQARGTLETIDGPEGIERVLRGTVNYMERDQATPWQMDILPAELSTRLKKAVRAFRFRVTRLEGTFKLSQNKGEIDRSSVIMGLMASGDLENTQIAQLMATQFGHQR